MTETVAPDFRDLPVRFSMLRAYGRSAAHGLLARSTDMKPTAPMQLGTAVHAICFNTRKVVAYDGRRDKRIKEYQEFMAENADAEILTVADYDRANRMAEAVMAAEYAKPFLGGYFETRLLFNWYGLDCRATPDIRGLDYVCELKTTADASPDRFPWHAKRMCYPEQLLFQAIGCQLNGHNVTRHMIIAVESAPPYPVTLCEVQPRALDRAAKMLALWVERLKVSEESGAWPGYSQAIVPIDIPDEDEDTALIYAATAEEAV